MYWVGVELSGKKCNLDEGLIVPEAREDAMSTGHRKA